ncbi:16S rRNA (cytosine(1402)-N(4))-methyltransferase RsmH [Haliangium ochraceum]|uniref:Ribosomal RNA small subunit methyltransferase H n=1 Tax=Haliangium ochraceum (strain DSM 14365 / JCM 11303 / SMP-2) TaxID=502025 RepID=D0LZ26_HALO1|nr:16S rRNA (cytosine(1402)-N(4))-methyltransferase RsmH [Haliangium ochraceum]ACY14496.1 S-adenosyl-methyltransferase MraW [Haliangium ochraceum DSM 14365]
MPTSDAFVHLPVLKEEVLAHMSPRPGGVYCDGTLGGGGHAGAVLARANPDGRLYGIDRDATALAAAQRALADFGERVQFLRGTYGYADELLAEAGAPPLDGILLDIGPSSPQFDRAERGFSFLRPGPIDMRMDQSSGETALDLMRRLGPGELADILWSFGEERFSKRIAARIKDAVRDHRLETTTDLAALVEDAIPASVRRQMKTHPATKTFQALRIAVNGELDQLARFLRVFPPLLAPGGRCVIISFHSLEDRLVKRAFRDLAWSSRLPPDLARAAGERIEPVCVPVTRKAVFASEDEIASNPRARSARLRACEKVAA